jgi:hypothetical protein
MAEPNHRTAIVVAVLGVVGTLGAALIANWDKIFPHNSPDSDNIKPVVVKPVLTTPPIDSVPRIAGVWRDSANPNNISKISQDGSSFQFSRSGILPNGVLFESTGTGALVGRQIESQYIAKYSTGASSSGQCSGSLSSDDTRIELRCSDSLLGIFAGASIRQ